MIVVADKSGQLGNRLFLFGHLIGFALEQGLIVFNPSFEEYASYFQATARDLFCRFPPPILTVPGTARTRRSLFKVASRGPGSLVRQKLFPRSFRLVTIQLDEKCDLNDARFIDLARNQNILLCGWRFRDHVHFNKHAAAIRDYFQPIKSVQENVRHLIQTCRADCSILVGIHIRRGDYREYRGGRYCFEDSDYLAVMTKLQQLIPGEALTFLICSNEPVAVETFRDCSYRLGTNHLVEDLYALAACDYLIGPPSTFSQWASFYGEVPLYQMRSSTVLESLSQFTVADSQCDYPEDLPAFSEFVVKSLL